MFTVEKTFNKQNDILYAQSSKEARELVPGIERTLHLGIRPKLHNSGLKILYLNLILVTIDS